MKQLTRTAILLLVSLALMATMPALAGNGTSSAEFLKLPILSRGASLGGALVATASGTEGLIYNPATLGNWRGTEVSLSHNELYQDLRLENVGITMPLGRSVAFGAAVTYLGYGQIDGYDVSGNSTGDVSAYSTAITLGASWRLSDKFSLGAAFKPIWESLGDYQARTSAFDFGLLWQSGQFTFGAQAANLGGNMTFVEEQNPLPRLLRVGAAYRTVTGSSLVTLAATTEPGVSTQLAGGIEYNYTQSLSMRVGYEGGISGAAVGTGSASLGVGLELGSLRVDYAYRPASTLGDTHQITLLIH